jgi:hypothetical protein
LNRYTSFEAVLRGHPLCEARHKKTRGSEITPGVWWRVSGVRSHTWSLSADFVVTMGLSPQPFFVLTARRSLTFPSKCRSSLYIHLAYIIAAPRLLQSLPHLHNFLVPSSRSVSIFPHARITTLGDQATGVPRNKKLSYLPKLRQDLVNYLPQ